MTSLVVVIDDEADMASLCQRHLETAPDLDVEVEAVDWRTYTGHDWSGVDVAIVDLLMPVRGVDVLRWLVLNVPEVYRIAWSAWVGPGMDGRLVGEAEALAHEVVTKSDLAALVEAVKEAE